jgi:hypothetical protein
MSHVYLRGNLGRDGVVGVEEREEDGDEEDEEPNT